MLRDQPVLQALSFQKLNDGFGSGKFKLVLIREKSMSKSIINRHIAQPTTIGVLEINNGTDW